MGTRHYHHRTGGHRVLPLVSANFIQEEWDALGKHGFATIPGRRRLIIPGRV